MSITAIRPKIFPTESPELKELFDKRNQLTEQLSSIDRSIMAAAHKTPAYSFIKGISGGGNIPVGIIEPQGHIAYELNAYSLDQRLVKKIDAVPSAYKATAAEKIAQLGEKTINSLLNGKALTSAEKRKLVVAMIPAGILDDKVEADAATDDDDGRPF
ncbi:hypothetical protein EQW76_00600 [Rhizobium sp. rho-13.1]|uniref:hypothetical protein n=1 Tax=Rhizobium sp. rho-13.1 TaxID=2506431 RepID=UPI00115C5404|nr:hypothetical protein [Rhizobium sp. rho-13.1]TQX91274.1 hypothetical protein EQW76_00600 [Rhizobium sp. rho-13.1]